MKRTITVLLLIVYVLGFGTPMTRNASAQSGASDDLKDSQAFLESAIEGGRKAVAKDKIDAQVEDLISKMTIEEKVGQMTQLEIGLVTTGKGQTIQIDQAKLEKAVVKYGAGSILNVSDEALSSDKWHEIIGKIQEAAKKTRLHIPVIYGIDSIHGGTYVLGSTLFPQEIGMAATWNPLLMQRGAEITAMETRAAGIPWNFSPVLDLGRNPLWPRLYETFGEDPYLVKVMGSAEIRGYEGNDVASKDRVASCLKHYMGYSFPQSGRDRSPAWIPEIYLREYFMPSFQAAIDAGARSIMVNSGEINGIPVHADHHILTDILRNELGFKGLVVSDWQDIEKMVSQHAVAATEKEATRMAIMAGIDMSMVPGDYRFSDILISLVKEGAVPQSRIDEACRRILHLKFDLGLFETPIGDPSEKSKIGSAESWKASLQAAQESITLLKNAKDVLPLAKGAKVVVTGPTADSQISLNNGWTLTWQGTRPGLYSKDWLTVLHAIEGKIGKQNVTYVPGATLDKEVDFVKAVEAARDADAVIVCLGEGGYAETPGNIEDLSLNEAQLKLASTIAATGKPVILVLVEGRPRLITPIVAGSSAIVMAYNPGPMGGQALADVLFGDVNPSGKLPFTYPRYANALIPYYHKAWELDDTGFGNVATQPQFPFGFGLSYTSFEYSDLRIDSSKIDESGQVNLIVTVKNTGKTTGKEVVQVYLRDMVASVTPPSMRLKRFAKVQLSPGESKSLKFTLTQDDLSFVGLDNKKVVEPGDFQIMVGGLAQKFTLASKPKGD